MIVTISERCVIAEYRYSTLEHASVIRMDILALTVVSLVLCGCCHAHVLDLCQDVSNGKGHMHYTLSFLAR